MYTYRLLSHVFDPDLDKVTPREYIVYACPMGPLGNAIEDFMDSAVAHIGKNGAHKSFPHVTLCQFFKVRCTYSICMCTCMCTCMQLHWIMVSFVFQTLKINHLHFQLSCARHS